MTGDANFEVERVIMPAFSKSVSSSLSQPWCLRGNNLYITYIYPIYIYIRGNNLPPVVQAKKSTDSFRKCLKTFLFGCSHPKDLS